MEIFEGVFLGDKNVAQNPLFMIKNNIKYVLNCSSEKNHFENSPCNIEYILPTPPNKINSTHIYAQKYEKKKVTSQNGSSSPSGDVIFSTQIHKITYFKIEIPDERDSDFTPHFDTCCKYIARGRSTNSNVLVHCFRGKSRSVTAIVSYGMYILKKYLYHSWKMMCEKVSNVGHEIQVQHSFKQNLMDFEFTVFGHQSHDFFRKRKRAGRPVRGDLCVKKLHDNEIQKAVTENEFQQVRKKRKIVKKAEKKKEENEKEKDDSEDQVVEKVKKKKKKKKKDKKKKKKKKKKDKKKKDKKKKKKKKKKKAKKEHVVEPKQPPTPSPFTKKNDKKNLEKSKVGAVVLHLSSDLDGGYWSNSLTSNRRKSRKRISYIEDEDVDFDISSLPSRIVSTSPSSSSSGEEGNEKRSEKIPEITENVTENVTEKEIKSGDLNVKIISRSDAPRSIDVEKVGEIVKPIVKKRVNVIEGSNVKKMKKVSMSPLFQRRGVVRYSPNTFLEKKIPENPPRPYILNNDVDMSEIEIVEDLSSLHKNSINQKSIFSPEKKIDFGGVDITNFMLGELSDFPDTVGSGEFGIVDLPENNTPKHSRSRKRVDVVKNSPKIVVKRKIPIPSKEARPNIVEKKKVKTFIGKVQPVRKKKNREVFDDVNPNISNAAILRSVKNLSHSLDGGYWNLKVSGKRSRRSRSNKKTT